MVPQMIIRESRYEVVTMVVAIMATQFERHSPIGTRRLEQMRMELPLEKLIGQPLVDEDF